MNKYWNWFPVFVFIVDIDLQILTSLTNITDKCHQGSNLIKCHWKWDQIMIIKSYYSMCTRGYLPGWPKVSQIYLTFTLNVSQLYLKYTSYVFQMYLKCTLYVLEVTQKCTLNVLEVIRGHSMYLKCTSNVSQMYLKCTLNVLEVTECTSNVPEVTGV